MRRCNVLCFQDEAKIIVRGQQRRDLSIYKLHCMNCFQMKFCNVTLTIRFYKAVEFEEIFVWVILHSN